MDTTATDSFKRINNHVYDVSPLSLIISLLADPLMGKNCKQKKLREMNEQNERRERRANFPQR